jgi:hypothetical protein
MIKYIAILLLIASTALAAENNSTDPMTVLDSEGLLVVSDGSSIYRFNKDGTFLSHPSGMSGRAFRGTWTAKDRQPSKFTAIAELYWQNGFSAVDDYREITFLIYPGHVRPASQRSIGEAGYEHIFDCYFIIEELKKIPKPEKAQQSGAGYPPQGVGSPDP